MDRPDGFPCCLSLCAPEEQQADAKQIMTTKKQSELGLLRQVAIKEDKHNSYIPSRNSAEKQQMMESTPQLKVQTQFKGYQLKTATGNL